MTPKPMVWLLIITGIFGFVIQLLPTFDSGPLLLLLFSAMILAVDASSRRFDEREEQLLFQAYSATFQRSLVVLVIVYGFSELSKWLGVLPNVLLFLNAHWLGLIFSGNCLLLGITGLQSFRDISTAVPR